MNLTISLASAIALAAVISSEHIDAWGKLGASTLLGALLIGFGFLHWKVTSGLSKAHRESCKSLSDAHTESSEKLAAEIR